MKTLSAVLAMCLMEIGAVAQSAGGSREILTENQIQQAIRVGTATLPEDIGLSLSESNPWSLWLKMGFGLTIHTPTTWVRYLASRAAADGQPFTETDVDASDRAAVLRVYTRPATFVRLVTIRGQDERLHLQPMRMGACPEYMVFSVQSRDVTDPHCLEYIFDGIAVADLRARGDGEFVVAVKVVVPVSRLFGTVDLPREMAKDFQIKRKHLEQLP